LKKFGLIGFPLGHSFSKKYFQEKFRDESLNDCRYDNYEVNELAGLVNLIKTDHNFTGLNVTIPYKSEILRYIDLVDDEAAEIGAVNVLKVITLQNKRIIKGFNSDNFGFRESLKPYLETKMVKNALILGTGGSSKAVAYALEKLGIKFTYVSRNPKKGQLSYKDAAEGIIRENLLIINTTPLGMFPKIEDKPGIGYNDLTPDHILYDLVYNPELTAFLQEGVKRGSTTIGGLRMLHLQAERSWEIWNDDKF
jgi:shikimate dehydrogenase